MYEHVRTATFAWYIVVGLFLSQLSGELCCFLPAERRSKNCERVVVLVPVAVVVGTPYFGFINFLLGV